MTCKKKKKKNRIGNLPFWVMSGPESVLSVKLPSSNFIKSQKMESRFQN